MRNGYSNSLDVETQGLHVLLPYIERHVDNYVVTAKGKLARFLQLTAGDVIANANGGMVYSVEIKTELENKYDRLFLETWSNRNLDDADDHAFYGSNRGWLDHLRADFLFYYFLDSDELYTMPLFELKRWAFGYVDDNGNEHPGRIYKYRERLQKKYDQANDTLGRPVPISDLEAMPPEGLGKQFKGLTGIRTGDVRPLEKGPKKHQRVLAL